MHIMILIRIKNMIFDYIYYIKSTKIICIRCGNKIPKYAAICDYCYKLMVAKNEIV